jgi:hypothetical protein
MFQVFKNIGKSPLLSNTSKVSTVFNKISNTIGTVANTAQSLTSKVNNVNNAIQSFAPVAQADMKIHAFAANEYEQPWYKTKTFKIGAVLIILITIGTIIYKSITKNNRRRF